MENGDFKANKQNLNLFWQEIDEVVLLGEL